MSSWSSLFTFLAALPTDRSTNSLYWKTLNYKDNKLPQCQGQRLHSKAVSSTKVNIVNVFNYESPTSSPCWSTSKGMMTSCMGRVIWRPSLVRSTTVLTWPSRPLRNSSMRARPHKCLGRTSSWIRMTSPRRSWAAFPTGRWTSWKFVSSSKYSFVHFQKSSESFCFDRSSLVRFCRTVGPCSRGYCDKSFSN